MEELKGGRPITIVTPTDDHEFVLDEDALREVLFNPAIKDKHVVVLSVAGAFRKGKSFLLDFFLRYLRSNGSEDWLGPRDDPLTGFSWRGGMDRDTTGILLWSEVFTLTSANGEEVAVLLMDTQGAFDSDSTVKDCATVFALSTMLSSVLIYNLSQNIQEDDLQHLQLFTEYGRLALEDSGRTPFQKLCFLIRDWSFPYESPYGVEGGRNVLEKRLQISERQHKELQQIRKQIRSCFEELSCFLLPHPGLKVATDPKFDGKLADMEDLFVKYVGELIPSFLAPEKLTIKEIGGQKIVCKDLVQYFKSYVEIYKGGSLPEPKTMLEATAEANNLSAVSAGRDAYSGLMENVCGGNCPYLSTQDLYDEHQRIKARAIDVFKHMPKMGGEEYSEGYELKLENELEELYEKYKSQNESKNIFKAAKTPAVLMTLALVMYIAGTLFHFLGLALPSFACTLIVMCSFASLMAWAYARYTGEARQFGIYVDGIAELLWKNFMKPASEKVLDRSGGVAKIVSVGNAIKDGLNATAAVPGPGGDRKNR